MNHSGYYGSTLIDVLRQHASQKPDATAYTFLLDGEDDKVSITYAELDRRARAVASHLQSLGMQGERALLLYPQGIEYLIAFWGCLYAQVIAIPLYPPSPKLRSLLRIQAIASDASCKLVLSTKHIISAKKPVLDQLAELQRVRIVATDAIPTDSDLDWCQIAATPATLAYLQYTSGSTSTPKGVMISHGNLLHNLEFMRRMYCVTSESVFVTWAPLFHDMGLIMGTLLPLCVGFPCIFMSPASFAQRPFRWLRAITRFRGTVSFGSNFAFDLCVDRISMEQREALDLSSWSVAINGSEPVRAHTLDRFSGTFGAHGFTPRAFYPSYGLAEATLVVSCGHISSPPSVTHLTVSRTALERGTISEVPPSQDNSQVLVGCGLTQPDGKVVIVDPERLEVCAPDQVGEIWASGPSVAQGYWGRIKETASTFHASLPSDGDRQFLRTGDLGFLRNGELFITGRLKDLVIIRGRNIYPQDIELTVQQSHPSMRPGCGAAFPVEIGDEEQLVVVQEIQPGYDSQSEDITPIVRRSIVEEHEVQPHAIVLVRPGSILKTSSGKIQRRACRDAYLNGTLEVYDA